VSPAFPKIVLQLGISDEEVGLLITAFTIPGIALTLPSGIAADRFGRKHILVPSLLIFGIAGGLCTFSRDFAQILVLRFVQGIGAAPLNSLALTVLGDIYSNQQQQAAISYNTSIAGIGITAYPAIGGLMATFEWYYPFALSFISIPIAFIVLFWLDIPNTRIKIGFSDYLAHAGNDIKNWKVIGLLFSTMATFFVMYGAYMTYFPIFLASRFNAEPWIIGVYLASITVVTAFIASILPKLPEGFTYIRQLALSFILYAIASLILPLITDLWFILFPLIIYGVGRGMCTPSIRCMLSDSTSTDYRGAVMSMSGTATRIGQTLGPLFTGVAFIFGGIEAPFILCVGLSLVTLLPIFLFVETTKTAED
jgi:MFS family permease